MLKISSSGTSNPGKKKINEDNFYMNGIYIAEGNAVNGGVYSDSNRRRIQFYAVFDGIGEDIQSDINPNINFHDGQNSSFIAADMLARLQRHLKTKPEYNLNEYVFRYVRKTNKNICDYMQQKNIRTGTSFALLCFDKNTVCAYNVGNSKIFILRDNRITLLSHNDTKVENLIMAKQVSPDIARHTPDNKVLTQHLGIFDEEKNIDVHFNDRLTLRNGDKFLVCSDGLCDYLTDERIYQILSRDISEQEIVRDLISEAMQNGGRDNLTIIVAGINYLDENVHKKDILKPTSNVPPHFSPIRYRSKFSLKPKQIRDLAGIGGVIILFIVAIVILFNGPLKFLAGGDKTTESQSSETSSDTTAETITTVSETRTTVEITTEPETTFDIPTVVIPDDDTGNTGNVGNITVPATVQTTAAPVVTTRPPTVTNPPATAPPVTATAAPTTTETVTTSEINTEETTEPPATSEETTTSEQITEQSSADETVPTEVITEPPETQQPITQEETIAAENPGDFDVSEEP